ncbi:multidrug transporter [Flammeovirga kamogawensis]|uniref:Multidrug transporter n=1 Tax=Flammeovirga kamogawensis TaxID=373891 RepID=A0ABX8GR06_9BACT|nr:multidrug transporter [Flammeovirga kamogawensis]MBB6463442.1 hypothetical protein [Flammeovirga kamogawensis]QWG05632.1 hypothetical protein KM029_09575 [Flammeovirga kamogawensis]TRX67463.1 multidrug transporter [Flammeovirga kamogawensis]
MKKQFRQVAFAALIGLFTFSCDSDSVTGPIDDIIGDTPGDSTGTDNDRLQDKATAASKIVANGAGTGAGTLPSWAKGLDYAGTSVSGAFGLTLTSGELTDSQLSWSGNVSISGAVKVPAGKTLTIAAGTVIEAQSADSYVMVVQDAKIDAQGTADNMIVFTAKDKTPGAWGGLLVNGRAPINNGDSNGEASPEVDSSVKYGGSNVTDDSGVLSYVRVEFSGYKYGDESEHNGFTFSAVGSGTELSYLQAFKGTDDGLEWFGGTVNGENLVSVGCEDDSFDWAHGYVGSLTNLWVIHDNSRSFDKAFEIDNNSKNNSAEPYTNAKVTNVTVEGVLGETTAFRVREGAKGSFLNVKVTSAKKGFDIHNNVTINNVLDNGLTVSAYTAEEVDTEVVYVDDCESCE